MNSILLQFGALDPRIPIECRLFSLRQFQLPVRIGAHDWERTAPQRMWFDLDVCADLAHTAAAIDHLTHTLDYDFMRQVVIDCIGTKHHELQETLCDAICQTLLAQPKVRAVRVATRKPVVYPDCASVGVERIAFKPT